MKNILDLHTTGASKTKKNKFSYQELTDGHFNQGFLRGVETENNTLCVPKPIFHLVGDKIEDASDSNIEIVNHNVTIQQDPETGIDCINLMGGYLAMPMDCPIVTSDEDFTIEWWERAMGTIASSGIFQNDHDVAERYAARGILLGHSGTSMYMATQDSSSWNIANNLANKNVTTNQWVHWAFVKQGNVYTMYRNGTKHHSVTYTAKFGSVNGFSIGAWLSESARECTYNALIRQYKIWDYARYTENFYTNVSEDFRSELYRVSPTIDLPSTMVSARVNWEGEGKVDMLCNTEDTSHIKLLLHGDEAMDASMYNTTIYRTNELKITEGKFDKAFELSNGAIKVPYDCADLSGLNDFTVDWWENIKPGVGSNSGILSTRGTASGLLIGHHQANTEGSEICIYASTNRHSWDKLDRFKMGTKVTNVWVHRAVCWSAKDSTIYAFQDGNLVNSKAIDMGIGDRFQDNLDYTTLLHAWGGTSVGSRISELRITDTCEWTEDFTPAIRPYDIHQEVISCKKNGIVEIPKGIKNIQFKQTLEDKGHTISNFSLEGVYSPRQEIVKPKDFAYEKELYLYNLGNEFVEITGGWLPVYWDGGQNFKYTAKTPEYLEFGDNNGGTIGYGGFVQNYGVDFTSYSTLIVDIQKTTHYHYSGGTAQLVVCLCQNNKPNSRDVKYVDVYVRTNSNGRSVVEIDVSKYNGIYHVGVYARNQTYVNNTCVGRLHSVKLVK